MKDFEDLITAFRENTLGLVALLDAVEARGARPTEDHLAELAALERLRDDGALAPAVATALSRRLQASQHMTAAQASQSQEASQASELADATRMKPGLRPALEAGLEPALNPALRPSPRVADAATVVQPTAARASPYDDATVVKPASRHQTGTGTGTGTGSDSSRNQASWRRIAEAEAGVHASVGMLLKGRFLLERELGRGGMGVVYLARDERKVEARDRDPYVAVKVLNDEFRRHPDSLIALQREARRAQQLAHDNIVRVYDFDKDGTIVFMTMEYIDGTDLRTLIRERAYAGMRLDVVWPLIEGMAHALERAHANGIVHSDFKPANVMVTREGVAKVFDFGIARAGKYGGAHGHEASHEAGHDARREAGQQTGYEAGRKADQAAPHGPANDHTVFDAGTLGAMTPAYASLEMIEGKQPTSGDDVYAFGCVIVELLTGQHPFDKLSAQAALAEGRKAPFVPGLTKRQNKALADSLAFSGEARLQSALALLEGLRRRRLHERLAPYVAGAAVLVLLAVGGWLLHGFARQRHADDLMARFSISDPRHFSNEDQAAQALNGLGNEQRRRIVLEQGDVIQNYLLARLDEYWNPAAGRLDYAAAQHVFQLRERLELFSTALDARRKQIDDQRNTVLGDLSNQLDDTFDNARFVEGRPAKAADVIGRIRALDPHGALLTSAALQMKFDASIRHSIANDKFDEARAWIELGLQMFPDSAQFKHRRSELAAAVAAVAAGLPVPGSHSMTVADARRALTDLASRPAPGDPWRSAVANAMAVLQNDTAPETGQAIDALADGIVVAVGRVSDPAKVQPSLSLVDIGLKYDPQSTELNEQRDRLQGLLQQQKIDQQVADDEVASAIDSLRRAAAANDADTAQESFDRLKALQPGNPFLTGVAPQLVSNAYLGDARALCRQGGLTDAANLASQGAKALGALPELSNAAERYELAAALETARKQHLTDVEYQGLQARYDADEALDPDGMKQLDSDIGASRQLPRGGLRGWLAQIKARVRSPQNGARAGAVRAPAQWTRDPA
ncbi:non-specific serine/threonine protein kinase [Paraburkholderia rhizosphaerae]|uniref:Non-specific serine/threonine protein kinase n=1 Tax=Paraburkholderia rhizosphaerae TaxID=480658 RepID=A0A4R8LX61_9BURK|nr:serine/threonine-protein kinase [Paraburkholderia rhizosphaerae]TDY52747.1 non-specific serine/threonine protein kinase [Paraburkholderia rhizosphaerae]